MLSLHLVRHCFSPVSSFFLSLFRPLFPTLSIASGTSHRVTDPRHLLSVANCRGQDPGWLTFWKFVVSKKASNEQTGGESPGEWIVRNSFVGSFVRSLACLWGSLNHLFSCFSFFLFFFVFCFLICCRFHGARRPVPADRKRTVGGE